MIYVYPAPERTTYFPMTRDLLPPVGAYVPDTEFWIRRLRDGDVILGDPPIVVVAEETPPVAEPADESLHAILEAYIPADAPIDEGNPID